MAVAEGFNCISNLPSSIPVSFIRVSPPGEWRYSLVNRSIYLLFLFEVPFPSEIKANLIIIIIIIIIVIIMITYHAKHITVTRFCHQNSLKKR